MLQRNDFFNTSAIAMHCRAQEFRCSTNFMSMSPASSVILTARGSEKVQPFPPQPVVIASLQTAATFSRNDFCLILIKLGKSFAISLKPYVLCWVVGIVLFRSLLTTNVHEWTQIISQVRISRNVFELRAYSCLFVVKDRGAGPS